MRLALAVTLLMLCAGTAPASQGPLRLDQSFSGFGPPPAEEPDLAPPAPEPPREAAQAPGLRLGPGAILAPSTLDRLDAHDRHRELERGPRDDGRATGLTPYLPERLGATLTFPF